MSQLTLEPFQRGDTIVILCSGDLLEGIGDGFHTQVFPFIAKTKRLVLDLADLSEFDDIGLGCIVRCYVSAKNAGCDFAVSHVPPGARPLFEVAKLLPVLEHTAT